LIKEGRIRDHESLEVGEAGIARGHEIVATPVSPSPAARVPDEHAARAGSASRPTRECGLGSRDGTEGHTG
jgi:hypothetical protein